MIFLLRKFCSLMMISCEADRTTTAYVNLRVKIVFEFPAPQVVTPFLHQI